MSSRLLLGISLIKLTRKNEKDKILLFKYYKKWALKDLLPPK